MDFMSVNITKMAGVKNFYARVGVAQYYHEGFSGKLTASKSIGMIFAINCII